MNVVHINMKLHDVNALFVLYIKSIYILLFPT